MANRHRLMNKKCKRCGCAIDDRNKKGYCFKHTDFSGVNNPFYHKEHTLEFKKRMSQNHADVSGSNNPFYGKKHSQISLKKMTETHLKNWKNYSNDQRNKILKNWVKANRKKSKTLIEERINEVMSSFGLKEIKNYNRNVKISIYNVDFLIDNKFIIDCYGDYWHKNPKYYNDLLAQKKRQKDEIRKIFLEEKGYKFIYFWGEDILENQEIVIDKIKNFLGQYYNIFEWEACCDYQDD